MDGCKKLESFPKGHGGTHNADELVSLERLERAMKIYAKALLALNDMEWWNIKAYSVETQIHTAMAVWLLSRRHCYFKLSRIDDVLRTVPEIHIAIGISILAKTAAKYSNRHLQRRWESSTWCTIQWALKWQLIDSKSPIWKQTRKRNFGVSVKEK